MAFKSDKQRKGFYGSLGNRGKASVRKINKKNDLKKFKKDLQIKTDKEVFRGYKVGELRKSFEKYEDKTNWKNPINTVVLTKKEADKLSTAIIFYHGTKPKINKTNIVISHKEGLVGMETSGYSVESTGYTY